MRRCAVVAVAGSLIVCLLVPGCLGLEARRSHVTPEQRARIQEWNEQAQSAIDRGDWGEAQVWLLRLVDEAPASSEVHQRLGRVFEAQGDYARAEAAYRKAVALEPEDADVLQSLAELEFHTHRFDLAREHIQASIEIAPQRAEAHEVEGMILEALGRPDEALAAYFRAVAADPGCASAMRRAAVLQLATGRHDQALARLSQVLELVPGDTEALFQRGRAHLALHHVTAAVEDFRAVSAARPQNPEVFYHLALALEQARQPEAAFDAARHALALAPEDNQIRTLTERLRR